MYIGGPKYFAAEIARFPGAGEVISVCYTWHDRLCVEWPPDCFFSSNFLAIELTREVSNITSTAETASPRYRNCLPLHAKKKNNTEKKMITSTKATSTNSPGLNHRRVCEQVNAASRQWVQDFEQMHSLDAFYPHITLGAGDSSVVDQIANRPFSPVWDVKLLLRQSNSCLPLKMAIQTCLIRACRLNLRGKRSVFINLGTHFMHSHDFLVIFGNTIWLSTWLSHVLE